MKKVGRRRRVQHVYLVFLSEDYEGPSKVSVFRSKKKAEAASQGIYLWAGPIPIGDSEFHDIY